MKFIVFILFLYSFCPVWAQKLPYKDASLTPEERTMDLLKRMTIEEKIGQLLCPMGWSMYDKQDDKVNVSHNYRNLLDKHKIGMLWATFRADPWTKKQLRMD